MRLGSRRTRARDGQLVLVSPDLRRALPVESFMDDLDVDSLTMVEIAVRAEQELGVRIPDDELPNLKTVGDAVNYVSANST